MVQETQQLIDHSAPRRAEGISPASLLLQGVLAELLLEEAAWMGGEGREAGFGPQGPCPPMPAAGSSWPQLGSVSPRLFYHPRRKVV